MVNEPIRVLVVDDHEMFSDALSLLLDRQPELELVGAVGDAEGALERARELQPDVVLMDLDLPGMDGVEATRRMRDVAPNAKVVIVTAMSSPALITSALAAGACGYVQKTRAVDDLLEVVRRAAAGEIVMPASDLQLVLEQLRGGESPHPIAGIALGRLTARETEILRALAAGEATSSIATTLGISPLTVQSHVKSILAKLGVHSKIEAVTLAWRHGIADVRTA
jgi:two-component system nitrate/nitrite response regulator NarL